MGDGVPGGGGGGGDGEGGEGVEVPRESQIYVDAKTYVYLEIELHRPLIPKRPASVLAERYIHVLSCLITVRVCVYFEYWVYV